MRPRSRWELLLYLSRDRSQVIYAPTPLAADPSLIEGLIGALGTTPDDLFHGDCIAGVLSGIDFGSPDLTHFTSALLSKLLAQKSLSDGEIGLIEKSIPVELFVLNWRKLAASKTGGPRLAVYRIAASRGLAKDVAIALFTDVLSAETGVLGLEPDDHNLEYDVMPAAVRGLVATGERGRVTLGQFLRGERGPSLARRVIALELTRLDRQVANSLIQDLAAATRDKDPKVRSSVIYALSSILDGEVLLPIVRPLFADPDQNVLYQITDLITGNGIRAPPGFLEKLSADDAETIAKSIGRHSYPFLRAYAPSLLVKFHDRLPPTFTTQELTHLLLDSDEGPRQAALDVVGDLGRPGIAALEDVLSGHEFARLLNTHLVSGVAHMGPAERQELLPILTALRERYPQSAVLLAAVGTLASDDSGVSSMVEQALVSDQADLRTTALKTLSARRFFSASSQLYLAALIDQQTGAYLDSYLGNVLEEIRPYFGPVLMSGRSPTIPQFPWLPPQWSFKEVVPRDLVGSDDATLGQISDRLAATVRAASPDFDYGLFEIPGGFVMLARLERIKPDGSPFAGRERWDSNPIPPRSLNEYLIDLFFSPPGYFRIVALAVTGEEPTEAQHGAELPSTSAGAKTLPDEIAKLPFKGHQVFAFVYTFERYDGAKMVLNYEGSPSGLTHLVASGIWGALQTLPR